MGWLGKIFGATPREELDGIRLDIDQPFWEIDGKTDFPHVLRAFVNLLPARSIMYFEGGSPNNELLDFFAMRAIPEQTHVAVGTLWPRPVYYHVPATLKNLQELADLSEHYAEPELAEHFHVYRDDKVLLEWHDAFDQPMLLSGDIPEGKVTSFARTLSMRMTKWRNFVERERATNGE